MVLSAASFAVLMVPVRALSGWAAHFRQARAFGAADASAVIPFDFLRLPFGAALAWLLFAEATDFWTWSGAAIIFGSTWFITWRERARRGEGVDSPRGRAAIDRSSIAPARRISLGVVGDAPRGVLA